MTEIKVDGKHGGTKMDGDKAQYGLLPPDSLKAVAEVMTSGAKKYSANNWVNLEISRVMDALERHINAFKSGEEYAEDSGQHHLAHAMANTMMAYHIIMNKPAQDDRLFKYIAYDKVLPEVAPETPYKFPNYPINPYNIPLAEYQHKEERSINKDVIVDVGGTFACPHCGLDKPHTHSMVDLAAFGRKTISIPSEPIFEEKVITEESKDKASEFLSEDEIFEDLIKSDTSDIIFVRKEKLISLNHTTGKWIRNTYRMWDKNNPYVVHDHTQDDRFPDQVSQRIIERLHAYWADDNPEV
jgi:hypothetical protein